jgi:uncharacterized protein involved in exopolysaccharide biosynthesis
MFRLASLRFLESYFRHRWLYMLPILITVAVAARHFIFAQPKYQSQGVLYVQKETLLARLTSVQNADVYWQTPAAVASGDIKDLLGTDAFVRAVIQSTDLENKMSQGSGVVNAYIVDVRKKIWPTVMGSNQVRISGVSDNPLLVYQMVNSTIETYIKWKINADQTESDVAHQFLSGLIDNYKSELDQARANMDSYLTTHPDPLKGDRPSEEQIEIKRLQAEVDLAQTRYTNALNKDEDARLAKAQAESDVRQSYIVIDAPTVPAKPLVSLRSLILQLAVYLAVGVLVSLVAIVGGAVLDRSFHFPIDVWHGVNLPVLAIVPDVPLKNPLSEVVTENASPEQGDAASVIIKSKKRWKFRFRVGLSKIRTQTQPADK